MNETDPKPRSRHAKMFELLRQSKPRRPNAAQRAVQEKYLDENTADKMILRGLSSLRPLGDTGKIGKKPARRSPSFSIRTKDD
ncbi:hypothetical protein Z945_2101 [Sulfitobacter noctilucae]|uniref:hypothetical protein n=1 Tax=Sulfitobacter noctilucae TaxID=1342302 RepID=UPI000469FF88|nr:hypothetical protein [Sulfitobacter noctilucae]KIN61116.1 hypothetical protein Z945_2101 [Sulfitobacter noctilucae]